MRDYKIYAVDFDNTLAICEDIDCTKGAVEIIPVSKANDKLIDWIKERQALGDKFILWTCRNGSRLDHAIDWCIEQGLRFDAVNCLESGGKANSDVVYGGQRKRYHTS